MITRLRLKAKQKWFPFIYAYLIKFILTLLMKSCRFKISGLENIKQKSIIMLWHNRIPITTFLFSRYTPTYHFSAVISKSRDGEVLSVLTNSYPNGKAIRVPHNARHDALKQMLKSLRDGNDILVMTPDGPRGPRYEIKPGIMKAAEKTGAQVIPLSWCSNQFWQLKSWDKMIIPKPFSTIHVKFGTPIGSNLKETLLHLDKEMCEKALPIKINWPK